jgi:hypothetical protein
MEWVALPGAYAPASIALRVIGAHIPPLHDKAVVVEGEFEILSWHFLAETGSPTEI